MKVILLQDVKSVGKKGDMVNVSEGYAKNFLIPRKLGVEATNSNLNDLKLRKQSEEKRKAEELQAAKDLKAVLEGKKVLVKVKAGEKRKLK